nr:hypothetical protein [Methanococcoides vulcani]
MEFLGWKKPSLHQSGQKRKDFAPSEEQQRSYRSSVHRKYEMPDENEN